MRCDAKGLLGRAAAACSKKDAGLAFALYELADNLATVMRGEATVEEFRRAYCGEDAAPFIRQGLMPGEAGYEKREEPQQNAVRTL